MIGDGAYAFATSARATRRQALDLRLARHHLAERLSAADVSGAAVVGLRDTPARHRRAAVDPFGRLPPSIKDELAAEAEHLAPFRGATTADVRFEAA
jgi:hypothetical protein